MDSEGTVDFPAGPTFFLWNCSAMWLSILYEMSAITGRNKPEFRGWLSQTAFLSFFDSHALS